MQYVSPQLIDIILESGQYALSNRFFNLQLLVHEINTVTTIVA